MSMIDGGSGIIESGIIERAERERVIRERNDQLQRDQEERDRKRARAERTRKILTYTQVGVFVLSILTVVASFALFIPVDYKYSSEVRGHVLNAERASTPELIISELNLAKEGMRNLDLSEDMYGGYFYFQKTPDTSMKFQYERIDHLINRTEDVILWRNQARASGNWSESLNDVYNTKIANIHDLVGTDGWGKVSNVAWETYLANYHPFFYNFFFVGVGLIVLNILLLIGFSYVRHILRYY